MNPFDDKQLVEMLGRNRLVNELFSAGLEVAVPVRDRGIDLIAYADRSDHLQEFVACPLQIKAATKRSFGLDKKYSKIRGLLIVYVWMLEDPAQAETYALTYDEAFRIAKDAGYTATPSWNNGSYVTNKPGKDLLVQLAPYKMTPEKWRQKVIPNQKEASCQQKQKASWQLH